LFLVWNGRIQTDAPYCSEKIDEFFYIEIGFTQDPSERAFLDVLACMDGHGKRHNRTVRLFPPKLHVASSLPSYAETGLLQSAH